MAVRKKIEKGFEEIRKTIQAAQSPFGKATKKAKAARRAKAQACFKSFSKTN